jgi:tryptophan synthase alpha chain
MNETRKRGADRNPMDSGVARIATALGAARAEERPAIAAFLTAGFPDRQRFVGLLDAAAEAADLVEIGVPFSDPMADGVTIQEASRIALAGGASLGWVLEAVSLRLSTTPLLLMSYLNPLLARGLRRLAAEAPAAGIAGFIVPDLPLEEGPAFASLCDGQGLALVQMVTPVTPETRLRALCEASRGFVYAVTSTGTTGGSAPASAETLAYLDRVRRGSRLPVLAGFGVRTGSQIAALAAHADGVIVGSALVEAIGKGVDPGAFLRRLREEAAAPEAHGSGGSQASGASGRGGAS